MGIGFSIFLIALGAILRFAVSYTVEGVNLPMIGMILMVVGAIGLLLSLLFWATASARARTPHRRVDEPV